MKRTILIVLAAVLVLVVVVGGWVLLRDETARERGNCGSASYELTVEEDDGALEVSYELQAQAPAETWTIVVTQGDATLLEGERITDDDAELDVDVAADEDGSDTFVVTATPADGEACVARLTR